MTNNFEHFSQNTVDDSIIFKCINDIEIKPYDWLWPDHIACGKVTVIASNPGLGKSQIAAYLAATVSKGGYWPDKTSAPLGDVVLVSAEDDAADTIKPRLLAAGANLHRCHVFDSVRDLAQTRSLDLREDVQRLEKALTRLKSPKLLVIDPISAYQGRTDSHNNSEIRSLIAPLAKMAERRSIALVLVTHLNKSQHSEIMSRVMGSIGLVAAARAGFVVTKDAQNPE